MLTKADLSFSTAKAYHPPQSTTSVVLSPLQLDTTAAENAPGVLGIITHLNAPKLNPVNMFPLGPFGESLVPLQQDVIYYSGQHLGIAIAETFEQATHAAALVRVSYESQSAIATLKDAIARREAPQELPPSLSAHSGNIERGVLQQGLADAEIKVDATYSTQVVHHNPMELSATIAVWDKEYLTLYDSTQWIYGDRNAVATMLGISQEQVRIVSHYVGGGFGCKCFTCSHVILAAIAAQRVDRPVKVVLTREQMFIALPSLLAQDNRSESLKLDLVHARTQITNTFSKFCR